MSRADQDAQVQKQAREQIEYCERKQRERDSNTLEAMHKRVAESAAKWNNKDGR